MVSKCIIYVNQGMVSILIVFNYYDNVVCIVLGRKYEF